MQIREISRGIVAGGCERRRDRDRERKREIESLTLREQAEQGRRGRRKEEEDERRRGVDAERVCILEDFLELITPTIINVA